MAATVYIMSMRKPQDARDLAGDGVVVNTTSKAKNSWQTDLSPFHLGPCPLYCGFTGLVMENSWQYAKVYKCHVDEYGDPTEEYWKWAKAGWANPEPQRYPMGRGARPLYSLWDGEKLGYIEARKKIYAPLYVEAVQKTAGWKFLVHVFYNSPSIVLRDYDGYRHDTAKMSLTEVLNCPTKIMGHAFVLKMRLTKDVALEQLELR